MNEFLFITSRPKRLPEVDEWLERAKLILELKDLVHCLESHDVKLYVAQIFLNLVSNSLLTAYRVVKVEKTPSPENSLLNHNEALWQLSRILLL